MSRYGECAVKAVSLYISRKADTPTDAWEAATKAEFGVGSSAQEKGCPRDAFLGLCEDGLVKGIKAGRYTKSRKNKGYTIKAVKHLINNPDLAASPEQLWNKVISPHSITHNQQIDVVIALWDKNMVHQENDYLRFRINRTKKKRHRVKSL